MARILNFDTKPMLACEAPDDIQYPVFASPKLDGIRAMIVNGTVRSRSMKSIPNHFIQDLFGNDVLNGLDGELIVGSPTDHDCYLKTNSGVMSEEGEPDVTFWVFDCIPHVSGIPVSEPYIQRNQRIKSLQAFKAEWMPEETAKRLRYLEHYFFKNEEELLKYEAETLGYGFEGVMIRQPNGWYKQGRSTKKEQGLMKLKRFNDDEAMIIGFEEQMHNGNAATINELGHTARSSHQANLSPMGVLGALIVRDIKTDVEFNIGTGYTMQLRKELWEQKEILMGKLVKYKHFKVGAKDKPRHPVFLGFRDPMDVH